MMKRNKLPYQRADIGEDKLPIVHVYIRYSETSERKEETKTVTNKSVTVQQSEMKGWGFVEDGLPPLTVRQDAPEVNSCPHPRGKFPFNCPSD